MITILLKHEATSWKIILSKRVYKIIDNIFDVTDIGNYRIIKQTIDLVYHGEKVDLGKRKITEIGDDNTSE